MLAGQALLLGGSEAQKTRWLPPLVAGEKLLTLAFQEQRSRYDLHRVATKAERAGEGWRLSGEKIQVLDGGSADAFIVSARTAGAPADAAGITLFLVPRDAAGLTNVRQQRVEEVRGCRFGVRAVGVARLGGKGVRRQPVEQLAAVAGDDVDLRAVHVAVDEARHDRVPAPIDDLGVRAGHLTSLLVRTHPRDAVPGHADGLGRGHRVVHGMHACVHDQLVQFHPGPPRSSPALG